MKTFKFNMVDPSTFEVRLESLDAFEYKQTCVDGTIRIKYPNLPELHVVELPRTQVRKQIVSTHHIVVCSMRDAHGQSALINTFESQISLVISETYRHFERLLDVDVSSGMYTNGGEFKTYVLTLRKATGVKLTKEMIDMVKSFDEHTITSFLHVTSCSNMPVLTWPDDSNPYNETWSLISTMKRIT